MARIMCKTCRRMGEKLCGRAKCALVRKPYPPGARGRLQRRRTQSEFGRQLKEKQKLKALYGMGEKQFRRYITMALKKRQAAEERLLWELERRFDTVVWRLGLAPSLAAARQLTAHGHFLVNDEKVTIPSCPLAPDDAVTIRKGSLAKVPFQDLRERLKKYTPPPWLELKRESLAGKVLRRPQPEDFGVVPAQLQVILGYYSR